jgi:hypothetical protein
LVANAVLRALLVAMDQWVSAGTEPPASRLPHIADGTLRKGWRCSAGSKEATCEWIIASLTTIPTVSLRMQRS